MIKKHWSFNTEALQDFTLLARQQIGAESFALISVVFVCCLTVIQDKYYLYSDLQAEKARDWMMVYCMDSVQRQKNRDINKKWETHMCTTTVNWTFCEGVLR